MHAKSDRGKQTGLKSTFGYRYAICQALGWTIDYLENGISWVKVQRMIIDAPGYEIEDEEGGLLGDKTDVRLTADNADAINNYINSMM